MTKNVRPNNKRDTAPCMICGSKSVFTSLVGEICVLVCNDCQFQELQNGDLFLDTDHWENYFARRQDESKIATQTIDKQYVVDAQIVATHVKKGDRLLDVGC